MTQSAAAASGCCRTCRNLSMPLRTSACGSPPPSSPDAAAAAPAAATSPAPTISAVPLPASTVRLRRAWMHAWPAGSARTCSCGWQPCCGKATWARAAAHHTHLAARGLLPLLLLLRLLLLPPARARGAQHLQQLPAVGGRTAWHCPDSIMVFFCGNVVVVQQRAYASTLRAVGDRPTNFGDCHAFATAAAHAASLIGELNSRDDSRTRELQLRDTTPGLSGAEHRCGAAQQLQ